MTPDARINDLKLKRAVAVRRLTQFVGLVAIVVAVALAIDYIRVDAKEARVVSAISQFGGRCNSLPAWPFGSEYRVTVNRALTSDELEQLSELNTLRGTVEFAFVDCSLSRDQIREANVKLHNCTWFSVVDGKVAAFKGRPAMTPEVSEQTTVFGTPSRLAAATAPSYAAAVANIERHRCLVAGFHTTSVAGRDPPQSCRRTTGSNRVNLGEGGVSRRMHVD